MFKTLYYASYVFFIAIFLSCTNNDKEVVNKNESSISDAELQKKYNLDNITLPAGFTINVFAEVPNARSMCWGAEGTLFVGNKDGNKVYAVVDNDNDGVANKIYTIAEGLNTPCGVAFKNGNLYVAEVNRILRFDDIEKNLSNPPKYIVIYDKLPTEKHHGWKFISFGPDGKLYIPIGAPCNVCNEKDSLFATISRMNDDGSQFEIFAKGVRNSVGFDWQPGTNDLWFTDNGRDMLGDDVPADELNIAKKKGTHFGFPFCHQGDISDPEFGKGHPCSNFKAPALKLTPHGASLGMRFYTGTKFPSAYSNQVFIAEHGSWNRSEPIGYRIMMAKVENGVPVQYVPFATGWLQSNGEVTGRPADIEITKDGALLVSDDKTGVIYYINYQQ